MSIHLYNTLTRKIEEFKPINPPTVTFYTCGATVYDYAHLGHLRKYTNDDLLKRALMYNDYKVKHLQNVTDVGHLTSDADAGEDKFEKGARREGKSVWEIAKFYEKDFYDQLPLMNILPPDIISRATEHIDSQIALIKTLMEKGFAYETPTAVFFDVTKFKDYGKLSGQKLSEKITGARADVVVDPNKKHPHDFALWVKRVGEHKNHTMHWESPWGDGFPGWHIECSAMAMQYLGDEIDIHTGGVDHIPVHHENEIAQSESATGKTFARFWVHHEMLIVDNTKMGKSLGNFYRLKDILDKGYAPVHLRYLYLTAHYRQKLNFTWEALDGAKNSYENLSRLVLSKKLSGKSGATKYSNHFLEAINDDLNIPKALAVFWEALKDENFSYDEALKFDKIFGLKLDSLREKVVPQEVLDLARKRDALRAEKKFKEADEIRLQIEKMGFGVEDSKEGTRVV